MKASWREAGAQQAQKKLLAPRPGPAAWEPHDTWGLAKEGSGPSGALLGASCGKWTEHQAHLLACVAVSKCSGHGAPSEGIRDSRSHWAAAWPMPGSKRVPKL